MTTQKRLLGVLALALLSALGAAQIRRLNLDEMAVRADSAIHAEIVAKRHFRVAPPDTGGRELYFTTLTLVGQSLFDGNPLSVQVTFAGGFDPETGFGVWNSEAPRPEEVQVGKRVVAFYTWVDNLGGGGFGGNGLHCSHGGLYETVESPAGTIVLGRGDGYAVEHNHEVTSLRQKLVAARAAAQQH